MKLIPLTQGMFAQVDNSDYPWLNVWKWYAAKNGLTYYAVRSGPRGGAKRGKIFMHRVILNTPDNRKTDHQDHNGLNNQRHNIRNATNTQNAMNQTARGKSKYLGVSFTTNGYIRSRIVINGKCIHLGYSPTEELAAKVYDVAAKQHFGEFANLNFK